LDASKICALADSQGWVLGETLEKALAVLEQELLRQQSAGVEGRGTASAREAISFECV
jgi:hypothetical protein